MPTLSSPLLTLPKFLYDTAYLKKTDVERLFPLIEKDKQRKQPIKSVLGYLFGNAFIITWNADLLREVVIKPDSEVWGKVGQDFSSLFTSLTGESVVAVGGEQWKKQRVIMKPSFKYTNLKNLLPGFQEISLTLLEKLDAECSKGYFEPHLWMSRATLDALGKCGFGMDFDALNGKMSEIYCAYEGLIKGIANPLLLFDWFSKLPFSASIKVKQCREEFWKWGRITVQNQLREMENNRERNANLLDMMIEAHFSENPQLNETELLQNIFLFFLAGHETTSGTLTFVLDALARHPDIQDKCRQEISSLFQPGEQPTHEKIKQLTYLNRVISETMRTKPLVSAISRQAKKDTTVYGYSVPKGTIVTGVISNLHFDGDTWENPSKFDPDRWIESTKFHAPPYFMPFGGGPRICLGMNFANLEMRTVLVNLLLRYSFGVKSELEYERSITLRPKTGYCLTISRL